MTEERFVKNEQYKELRPANVYDVAANETWLEDMARQGYRLVGMTGWSGVFKTSEPFSCRYRMQPLPKKEERPPEKVLEAYQELGWEYAGTIPGAFHVWRCEDPDVPELDTDPVVQGMGYRYLRRKIRWDIVCSALLLVVLVGLCVFLSGITSTPLLDILERFSPGQLTVETLVAVLLVVLMACQVGGMRRLLRFLSNGIPLERPRPYRRQKWLARALALMLGLSLVLHFFGGVSTMDGGSMQEGWDNWGRDGAPKAGAVYVDLAELEGAEETEFWSYRTKVQELCPRMYETQQLFLRSGEGNSYPVESWVETTYYRLLTEGLARQLAKELIQDRPGSMGTSAHGAMAPVETAELDGFWWLQKDDGTQYVVARLGRQVLLVEYEGETDLRTVSGYFAGLLTKN